MKKLRKRILSGILSIALLTQTFVLPVTASSDGMMMNTTEVVNVDEAAEKAKESAGETVNEFTETSSNEEVQAQEVSKEEIKDVPEEEREKLSEETKDSVLEEETKHSEESEMDSENSSQEKEENSGESIEEITEESSEESTEEITEESSEEPEQEQELEAEEVLEEELLESTESTRTEEGDEAQLFFAEMEVKLFQEGNLEVSAVAETGTDLLEEYSQSVMSQEETVQDYIYEQLQNKAAEINILEYQILRNDIGTVYHGLIDEHPDLYFVDGYFRYSYRWIEDKQAEVVVKITPTYLTGYDDDLFDAAVEEAMLTIEPGMSDLEKAIALHDYIVVNGEYDYANYLAGALEDADYSAYGILAERNGVCNGYALAYKYLCNLAGINCYMVTSDAMNHAWNLIELNGKYYQVDTTWDDPTWDRLGRVSHQYMFVSDEAFENDREHHSWTVSYFGVPIDYVATDITYDEAFWVNVNSPLIYEEHDYYYIDNADAKLKKMDMETHTNTDMHYLGMWYAWGVTNSYWPGGYSGLFEANNRLYFNKCDGIYSIDPTDTSDVKLEFSNPKAAEGYIYGSALQQGEVRYTIGQSPKAAGAWPVYVAEIENQINTPVSKVELLADSYEINVGKNITLSYEIYPAYATIKEISWSSNNEAVATVSNGVVTAVGEGTCQITVTIDGVSDVCQVLVKGRVKTPIILPDTETLDIGEKVTIEAEEGATIYYTCDGTSPTLESDIYKSPIVVNEDMTISAIAVKEGYENSNIARASYIVCKNLLEFSDKTPEVKVGETIYIEYDEIPTTKSSQDVVLSSQDENIATVSNQNAVTGVAPGETLLTATVEDHKGRTVTTQVTLTVKPITYSVRFWNGNECLESQTVEKGKDAEPPKEVIGAEGYEFTGWSGSYKNIQQDMDLYAQFSPIRYTIDYEVGKGVNAESNATEYTIEDDEILLYPPTAPKGYAFEGWYLDNEYVNRMEVIEAGTIGDFTLFAKYTPVNYDISYELDGGVNSDKNEIYYNIESETIVLENPSSSLGETFTGWYLDTEHTQKVTQIETGTFGDISLYAGWQLANPSFSQEERYVEFEEEICLEATRKGSKIYYTTDGSMPTEESQLYFEPIAVDREMTIQAIAVKEGYTTSEVAKKEYIPCNSEFALEKEELTLRNKTTEKLQITTLPTGKTLEDVRWESEDTGIVQVENGILTPVTVGETKVKAITEDFKGRTLVAECKVTILPALYKVEFYDENGNLLKEEEVEDGKDATAPEITIPAGYTFAGWDKEFTNVTDYLVLTAQFDAIKYPIHYVLEEGIFLPENPLEYTIETEDILLLEPNVKDGYTFIGWYDNEALQGTAITKIPKGSMGEKTFYGGIRYQEYRITYETNGGTLLGSNPTVYTTKDTILLDAEIEKDGYIFVGWYEDAEFSQNPISIIESGRSGDITLYAKWQDARGLWVEEIAPLTYTGGKVQPDQVKVYYGAEELTAGKDYTISYKNNINANDLSEENLSKAPMVVVTGKGNYSGSVSKNFVIEEKSIQDADVIIDDMSVAYKEGRKQTPIPKVLWNGKSLRNKSDFKITYLNAENAGAFTEPGDYVIRIEGVNNYSGIRDITVTIANPRAEEVLMSKVKIGKIPNQEYTGTEVNVDNLLRLTYQGKELAEGDYELEYEPCVEVGTHDIVIRGKGKFKGVVRTSFKITGISMRKVAVSGIPSWVYYTGSAIEADDMQLEKTLDLSYTYRDGNEMKKVTLEPDDYEVSFKNNKNKGTAQIIFTGRQGYDGTVVKNFRIMPYNIQSDSENQMTASIIGENVYYQKGGAKPELLVKFGETKLQLNKDYRVTYKNNASVNSFEDSKADAVAIITGIGNYTGKMEVKYAIQSRDIDSIEIEKFAPDCEEGSAGKYKSTPRLTDENGNILSAGRDYETRYEYRDENGKLLGKNDKIEAGRTLTVTIYGKNNYHGQTEISYRIVGKQKSLSRASVSIIKGKQWYYTGEKITVEKEDLIVKIGRTVLNPEDFEIIGYRDNIQKGTAKVIIRGKGIYGGTKQINFKINSQKMR